MTIGECYSRDQGRERTRNGGSRLKREEENDSKREQKKAEESGKGIESRIVRARKTTNSGQERRRKDFEERERVCRGKQENDLERI